jgi:hypothetical protein
MQAGMLKLHTRTQQALVLIVTAWCAARANLEFVTDRALENAHEFKIM